MSVLDLFNLEGQVALITGGGRGLGEQIACAFADVGATVVLASRRVENCEAVAKRLQAQGKKAFALGLDVTSGAAVLERVQEIVSQFGRLDIVVNNSGASWGAPAMEMPLEAWNKVINTNLTGTFLVSQAAAEVMKEQGRGKIVNIASVAGINGSPDNVLDAVGYSASKGGVITLTKDLAIKWAKYGIYVNAIAPGYFPTKMTKDVLAAHGQSIEQLIPLHRFGGDTDLQGAALYLASKASDYVTGHVLVVDGGMTAQ